MEADKRLKEKKSGKKDDNDTNNLEEATEFFIKMKQLPRKEFLKLFLVTEIK